MTDTATTGDGFDLPQIEQNGELIAVTLTGPLTYYDYHGRHLGAQYLLCRRFAERLGVRLRVEVCRDTAELTARLSRGDADLALLGDTTQRWQVGPQKPQLRQALSEWYTPQLLADVRREEDRLLTTQSVQRHVYSPMLNRAGGIISHYDHLFQQYSRQIRWDWRLIAALCYQESTFDPKAHSWAGACGLMQLMPATAAALGLDEARIYEPEANIQYGIKYIGQLEQKLSDIPDRAERTRFVLAAYNGGLHHLRDAMALTEKHGGNPRRWADVSRYVLLLSQPQYYNDPVVAHGYMRGSETVDYVERIHERWASYRGVRSPRHGYSPTPQKATHQRKKKYTI